MSLQEKINSDLTIAIKTKSTGRRDVLRVVIGEMNRVGKELEDKQVIKILKKMAENAKEINNEAARTEIFVLESYLPKEMSEKELDYTIMKVLNMHPDQLKQLKEGNKALIGFFIGKCAEMTEGSADNKKISEILKSKI